ncbi:TIGR02453 family protein [Rhodobacterales bacterium HKCCE4037]|nr:TIGR02453 family protein [Rhodobacterales bacterium HKCCE4037]
MSDGFAEMIQHANGFFTKLRANNNRDFFKAHKDTYTSEIRKPAELLADLVAEDLSRHTGKLHAPKVFRIHRDVRFSKDKTPYNTHLHMMWSQPGDAPSPAWFFGSAPDYLLLGMGVMNLQKESLTAYRSMIDRRGDDLTEVMETSGARLSDWGPDPLKRVPKPYDQDHPHVEFLKRKAFALTRDLPDGWQDKGLLKALNSVIPTLLPAWTILHETFPGQA